MVKVTRQKYSRMPALSNYGPHTSLRNTNYLRESVNARPVFLSEILRLTKLN